MIEKARNAGACVVDIAPVASRMMRRLDELGAISDEPDGLTRLYLSPAHARAVALVRSWMEEAGLDACIDDAATVCGFMAATNPDAPRLLIGSHIDTVRHAGIYDGCLGVAAAIAAAEILRQRNLPLTSAIEILAFGDEEGVRFPTTFTGSRAIARTFDAASLDCRDEAGVSLSQALVDFGLDPSRIASLARSPAKIAGYVELHIEQGPVLEAEGLPLGVVTGIAAAARFECRIDGRAGHAGTVPMHLRHDSFAACAELAAAIRGIAEAEGSVATIGRVTVPDGAVNVIPAQTRFSLDVRAADDVALAKTLDIIMQASQATAAKHGVQMTVHPAHRAPATACAASLQNAIASAIARAGIRPHYLASGAGHDAAAMAALCPVGMMFVRCRGGISHHPDEFVSQDDARVAVGVLADLLEDLCAGDISS